MRDYYTVLGVSMAATPVQIRRAYQQLARRYSPDVNLSDQGTRGLFEEISQAYRVLIDPAARSIYDRGTPPSADAPSGEARGSRRRGDDLHLPVELSFPQAATGLDADLVVDRLSACPGCGASGERPGATIAECAHCGGAGTVWTGQTPRPEPCPACAGSGQRVADACPSCRGRGVRPARAVVRVTIPPGMDTGGQLRVPGEGHAGPFAGPRGDLVVIARVHEDARWTRKGDNLHGELSLSIAEAVLGARVAVETLLGGVDVIIPPGTQSGQVFRVRGRGMPRLSADGRGDLYLTARVEVPRGLDARTQELLRELARLLPPPPSGGLRKAARP
jgi:molecular chaperone DnaJ